MADARNRANVIVGAPNTKASGGLLLGEVAKDTTNYPKNAKDALNQALGMKPAGFIGEDGVTKTVDRSTEKIKDWNKDTVIVVETDHNVTVKLTFLEAKNPDVLKAVYGTDNVTVSGDSVQITDSAGELPHFSLDGELNCGEGKAGRIFIPDGQVTSVSDLTFKKDDVVRYEVEIECFADKAGKKFYAWFDDAPAGTAPAEHGGTPSAVA